MDFQLQRTDFTDESTIGSLSVNGKFECFILEDKDRKLEVTGNVKVPAKTCIPRGKYQIVVTHSNRFGRMLPLLLNVPQFEGIRIHTGNYAKNTEGCLLPGKIKGKNAVLNSTEAWGELFDKILKAHNRGEKIWITIS